MAPGSDDGFYADLPSFDDFSRVADASRYADVPDTWLVVITDVRGSTRAIQDGRYRDVNALGVASLVAIRNAVPDVDLPFVFGGDGATVLVPESRRGGLESALRGLMEAAQGAFGLSMRAGVVPVRDLRAAGHHVRVARFAPGPHVTLAVFLGDGLEVAEAWVKGPEAERHLVSPAGDMSVSFEGFECRWRPVPSQHGLVASIIVVATEVDGAERTETYARVVARLGEIFEIDPAGCPISIKGLRFSSGKDAFAHEARLKARCSEGAPVEAERREIRKAVRIGKLLFATRLKAGSFNPRNYKQQVTTNTDYRKFDNVLRMHVDLTEEQLSRVRALLQAERQAGRIAFGVHTAAETLMTCIIDSYDGDHIHFVDGADGGYALAARQLKAQLKGAG